MSLFIPTSRMYQRVDPPAGEGGDSARQTAATPGVADNKKKLLLDHRPSNGLTELTQISIRLGVEAMTPTGKKKFALL